MSSGPQLWPVDVPPIQQHLSRKIRAHARKLLAQNGTDLRALPRRYAPPGEAVRADSIAHGQCWFVTQSMTELALDACDLLPEWSPQAVAPSPGGVVLYAAGTGRVLPYGTTLREYWRESALTGQLSPPRVPVCGMAWATNIDGELELTPLSAHPAALDDTPPSVKAGGLEATDGRVDDNGQAASPALQPLWSLLGTTWILATQPGLATRRSWQRRDGGRDPSRAHSPRHVASLEVITLREGPYDPDARPNGPTGVARGSLDHRVIVRGHWRNQACGPGRNSRKPIYIAPFIRGPEGTPLRKKPAQVFLWKR